MLDLGSLVVLCSLSCFLGIIAGYNFDDWFRSRVEEPKPPFYPQVGDFVARKWVGGREVLRVRWSQGRIFLADGDDADDYRYVDHTYELLYREGVHR